MRTGEDGPRGITCFIVEKGTPGLSFGSRENKLGWKTQPTSTVTFDGCRVPAANRVGEEGQGFRIAMSALDGGRINIAACSIGGAQFVLDSTLSYMHERRQFGAALAEFQALRFRCADFLTALDAGRLLLQRAAAAIDTGARGAAALAAMAKRYATDIGFDVVNGCMQIHGGYGCISGHFTERVLRDLRIHQIVEGTNEVMRLIIARDMLGTGRVPA
jgi:alkylation response protein AidB-like acyl-CoA dehydrogenase